MYLSDIVVKVLRNSCLQFKYICSWATEHSILKTTPLARVTRIKVQWSWRPGCWKISVDNSFRNISWAVTSQVLQCVEDHYLQCKWYYLDTHAVEKLEWLNCARFMAFTIDHAVNETGGTHLFENNGLTINDNTVSPQCTATLAEENGTTAYANGFPIAHFLQFCALIKL